MNALKLIRMKNLISIFGIVLCFFLVPLTTHAEYNGVYAEFEAIQHDKQVTKGYVYIPSAYFEEDSFGNSQYLIQHFDQLDWKMNDTIIYSKELIKYRIISEDKEDTLFDYSMRNKAVSLASEIKAIKITKRIRYSTIKSMVILHVSDHLNWMEKEPL
jgi:hypothetical protein